ncbi:MAG: hypothetical protein JWQ81_3144 [Amycolatopsis sp.]|uniref:hypothetical protein n=1 Tax=Amycolatopsis sp. TaxID=37632 RepID=UPI0026104323|nr:hypothetical protein [Amycolatopsis sp.]MCU1682405.1 hypothetical protein [Amycolatopsis sp.]
MTASTITKSPEVTEIVEGESTRRSRWLPRVLPIASILGGTAVIGWQASRYGSWIVDDAGITFAYSRSVAEGLGPVLQAGAPPVEGFSDPTWMVLLALGRIVGLFERGTIFGIPDYVLFPKALALVFCGGILTWCYFAAKRVTRRPWLATLVIGIVLSAIPSFVIWCFSGLENSLLGFTVVGLAVTVFLAVLDDRLLSRKVAIAAGAIAAFAALTRPEGVIYAGAYPLVVLIHVRRTTLAHSVRSVLWSVGAFAVPFGAYLTWRWFEFGRLLSNPAVAKSQQFPSVQDLGRASELVTYAGALGVLVLVVTVGMALGRPVWWRSGLVALLVPLVLAIIAYAVLMPDWMVQYRFATPVWVLASLTGTLATAALLGHAKVRGRIMVVVGLVVALAPSVTGFATAATTFAANPTVPMCLIADRFGRVFNDYADILGLQHGSLLLPDLGGSSLTSRLDLVDMAGLVDKKIADITKTGDLVTLRNYVFDDVKPTFIHSWGPWSAGNGIPSDPRLARDYDTILLYSAEGPPNGDWVRKDAVSNPAQLKALQTYGQTTALDMERLTFGSPLRSCGNTVSPGQVPGS